MAATERVPRDLLNHWRTLIYHRPADVLRRLRVVENRLADAQMAPMVRRLRTGKLKKERESRDAALFTYLVGRALDQDMQYAPDESADYDFVVTWHMDEQQHYCPVQLKELVPADLNPTATLDDLLHGLRKYSGASKTVLAIRLNRRGSIDLASLKLPPIPFAELWFFWSGAPSTNVWYLLGDALGRPRPWSFPYPTGAASDA
jgi:hypothetical protein